MNRDSHAASHLKNAPDAAVLWRSGDPLQNVHPAIALRFLTALPR
jgi:hypothetical protein